MVFSPDTYVVADNIGGYTALAPLWATHLVLSPSLGAREREDRFFQYLNYSGVSAERLEEKLASNSFVETCALFGYERSTRHLTRDFSPVSENEIEEKRREYEQFLVRPDQRMTGGTVLSWIIIPNSLSFDYSAIDRSYERDNGENLGAYSVFRVKLRSL